MHFWLALGASAVSGLYTSLWGAFKDSPFETLKPKTFPRSIYFNLVIFLVLYWTPFFRQMLGSLSYFELFFLVMGVERFLAELYKGFFRREDQAKYFVPSRITFFGRHVDSEYLRLFVGVVLVGLVFASLTIRVPMQYFWHYLLVAYATGLLVSLGGAYKDAPFEGFKPLKFQRSGAVLAILSPLFYFLADPLAPVPLGFLIYMNGGLERFSVEYYKTYIQRNMSGKFRPDLERMQVYVDSREKFHYMALAIIAGLGLLYAYEIGAL